MVVACQPSASGPPAFSAADAAAVRATFDSTSVRMRTGNYDSWANEFTEEAVFQPAHAKAVAGHAGLVGWAKALPPIQTLDFTNVKVAGDGNIAYGTSDYTLTAKGAPADTGKQLVVFRRQADGKWMVASAAFNSDLPMPMLSGPATQAGTPAAMKK
jgi:ketosteroid isomerase-like protein